MTKFFKDAWNARELIFHIAKSEQKASLFRFFLGEMWYVLVPLAQSLIYFFLITILFGSQGSKASLNFSFILMGIMHYSLFSQVSGLVLPSVYNGGQILLQVKLNPIILITSAFCRALQNWVIGVIIFLLYFVIFEDLISYRILIYPFVLLIFAYFCWVLGVILATLAVYVRDLEKMIPIIFQILMYLSPVIYPVSFYPEGFKTVLLLNPLASFMAILQWALLGMEINLTFSLLVIGFWTILLSWLSGMIFDYGSKHFTKTL